MSSPLSPSELTTRERELLTLFALGELTPSEKGEWQSLIHLRPGLESLAQELSELATQLAAQQSQDAELPAGVRARLEEARARSARHSYFNIQPGGVRRKESERALDWRSVALVWLPIAAVLMLAFVVLMDFDHNVAEADAGIKGSPVTLPVTPIEWQAPGKETSLLRPVMIWNGVAGKTYDIQIQDAAGAVLASAQSIQSPWPVEIDLPRGALLRVRLRAIDDDETAMHEFRVLADALPLESNLKEQMERMAATGNKADALMLLMRLPDGDLTEEAWAEWRRNLTSP